MKDFDSRTSYYERFAGGPATLPAPGAKLDFRDYFCELSGKTMRATSRYGARKMFGCDICRECDGCKETAGSKSK